MKCGCCGKPMTHTPTGFAAGGARPNCKCGMIRTRERKKGCPKCGSPGKWDIMIKKHWYGWLLYCICGHKWRVHK